MLFLVNKIMLLKLNDVVGVGFLVVIDVINGVDKWLFGVERF